MGFAFLMWTSPERGMTIDFYEWYWCIICGLTLNVERSGDVNAIKHILFICFNFRCHKILTDGLRHYNKIGCFYCRFYDAVIFPVLWVNHGCMWVQTQTQCNPPGIKFGSYVIWELYILFICNLRLCLSSRPTRIFWYLKRSRWFAFHYNTTFLFRC